MASIPLLRRPTIRTGAVPAAAFTMFLILVLALAPAAPAADQAAAYLAAHPGGQRVSANEVSYNHGAFVITFTRTAVHPDATADCPAGWFCFYDHTNYGYPRGKLSSCGWQDLTWWGWQNRTESAAYNLLNGSVAFLNHPAGTAYGTGTTLFTIGATAPARADVAPYRNMADYVYRYC